MSLGEFFGEVKEGLSWPTVWTRLHQLYPPSNRYIASYIFPLYTVASALSGLGANALSGSGGLGPALGMELFKCEGYVRRRLLENVKEGLEQDEFALLLQRVQMIGEKSRNVYDTVAHIAALLSMIAAEGFSPLDRRVDSYGSSLVAEYPLYTVMHTNTTADRFPGWRAVTETLSEWKNASQGYLSSTPQGPRLAPNETVKVSSDSILYVTKIEQCFQENFINRNKIAVPPTLWQHIDEIKSLQQNLINPPPQNPPPLPPFPEPAPMPPSSANYPYPPYSPALSVFGRPVIPITFEEAKTRFTRFMPPPQPTPPPPTHRAAARPPLRPLPPLLPLLPDLLPLPAHFFDPRAGGRYHRTKRY